MRPEEIVLSVMNGQSHYAMRVLSYRIMDEATYRSYMRDIVQRTAKSLERDFDVPPATEEDIDKATDLCVRDMREHVKGL